MPNGTHKYIFVLAFFLQAFTTNSLAELLPQTGWSLQYTDSEHIGYGAVNAFDGDPSTIWHTQFDPSTPLPHEIQISLGGTYQLSGFRYLPRQDDTNARIKQYRFYTSTDGINWGSPVAGGSFPNSAAEQEVHFTPVQAAFIRLVALSANDGSNLTTVAEINILGNLNQPPDGNQAPDGVINTPGSDLTINVGDTLSFTASSSDPDGNLPLTYRWNFGAGSGIPDAYSEDPGLVQFNTAGSFTVSFTVTDSLGLADPIPDVRIITVQTAPPQILPQTGWSLQYTDSEHIGYGAVNAFDGDPLTIWHTQFDPSTPLPHEIQISLGGTYQLSGFRYLPRQDDTNARIKQYRFYTSTDGINWGSPVASGSFPNSAAEQEVHFTPVQAAFIRLVALSANDGSNLTTVAELNILGQAPDGNQAPDSSIRYPSH